jgi:hypothetical protein
MKAESKNYKGIHYVQLNELPASQQDNLLKTLRSDYFIKIMIEGSIVSQCIQYKDYSVWYDKVFNIAPERVKEQRVPELVPIKHDLAFK